MAATFISATLYFMCFLLFLAFSLSRVTHPTSLMVDGCDGCFIVFISAIYLIILLIDKFITVMYFIARNSVERQQGVYILINAILID